MFFTRAITAEAVTSVIPGLCSNIICDGRIVVTDEVLTNLISGAGSFTNSLELGYAEICNTAGNLGNLTSTRFFGPIDVSIFSKLRVHGVFINSGSTNIGYGFCGISTDKTLPVTADHTLPNSVANSSATLIYAEQENFLYNIDISAAKGSHYLYVNVGSANEGATGGATIARIFNIDLVV